jgi:hypothetical protein
MSFKGQRVFLKLETGSQWAYINKERERLRVFLKLETGSQWAYINKEREKLRRIQFPEEERRSWELILGKVNQQRRGPGWTWQRNSMRLR